MRSPAVGLGRETSAVPPPRLGGLVLGVAVTNYKSLNFVSTTYTLNRSKKHALVVGARDSATPGRLSGGGASEDGLIPSSRHRRSIHITGHSGTLLGGPVCGDCCCCSRSGERATGSSRSAPEHRSLRPSIIGRL